MRLVIFLPNWVGDVAMATPTLRAVRKHFGPEAHLVGVMRPYVSDVLAGGDWFDKVIMYTKSASTPDQTMWRAIRKLRAEKLDRVLLLTNSARTALMGWLCGAPQRIGSGGFSRRVLLTRWVPKPLDPISGRPMATIDVYLRLAAELGCGWESPRLELYTTPEDEAAADDVWQQLELPEGRNVVVFNTGGAFGSSKNWPLEYFAELAHRIVSDYGYWVLLNCGPSERDAVQEVVARAADRRVVSLADVRRLPIGLSKACIRRSRMLVTTDSGPRFFGIAFGKPVVTLFGPTAAAATAAHYDRETCVSIDIDCRPCMRKSCPLVHHRCMRDLSVDTVYQAVQLQLDVGSSDQAA
jgi:lipopolysaccharide heptosyltransferase II